MKTKEIEKALIDHYLGKEPICSLRINQLGHEMDFLTINQRDFSTEYEIKISISDFKADFKKPKHKLMKQGKGKTRRFYFVTPKGMIEAKDIPSYAGWIEVSGSYMNVRKKAPSLRCRRVTAKEKTSIYRSMMYRYLKLV